MGTSNFALDAVRHAREQKASDQRRERDERQAARLLAEGLESGRRLLSRALETDTYTWVPPERRLSGAAWTEYRAAFARRASQQTWDAVAAAYAEFDEMNWHVAAVIEEERWTGTGPESPLEAHTLGPRSRELFTDAVAKTDLALGMLRDLMKADALSQRTES